MSSAVVRFASAATITRQTCPLTSRCQESSGRHDWLYAHSTRMLRERERERARPWWKKHKKRRISAIPIRMRLHHAFRTHLLLPSMSYTDSAISCTLSQHCEHLFSSRSSFSIWTTWVGMQTKAVIAGSDAQFVGYQKSSTTSVPHYDLFPGSSY